MKIIDTFDSYQSVLVETLKKIEPKNINLLISLLKNSSNQKKKIFIFRNGGSAANANHIEIDLLNNKKFSIDISSLNSNSSVMTCLANDYGYENIFSKQIENKGKKGDLLILLSGSGNSKNIIKAVKVANKLNLNTFGIFGYDGGKAIKLVQNQIHINSFDMQICEDIQMILFHFVYKRLNI